VLSSVFFVTDLPSLISYNHLAYTLGNRIWVTRTPLTYPVSIRFHLSRRRMRGCNKNRGILTRTEPGHISVIDDRTFSCVALELRQTGVYHVARRHLTYLGEDGLTLLRNDVPCGSVVDTT
jgi:hypothetical protein